MQITVDRISNGYTAKGENIDALLIMGRLKGKGSRKHKEKIFQAIKQFVDGEQLSLLDMEGESYNRLDFLSLEEIREEVEQVAADLIFDQLHGLDYAKEMYNRLGEKGITITEKLIELVRFKHAKEALRICLHYGKSKEWKTVEELKRLEYKDKIIRIEQLTNNQKEWIHNRLDQTHIIPLVVTMNTNKIYFTCMNGKESNPKPYTFLITEDGQQKSHGANYSLLEHDVVILFNSCTNLKDSTVIDARERFIQA